jgi:hypothetical protein
MIYFFITLSYAYMEYYINFVIHNIWIGIGL